MNDIKENPNKSINKKTENKPKPLIIYKAKQVVKVKEDKKTTSTSAVPKKNDFQKDSSKKFSKDRFDSPRQDKKSPRKFSSKDHSDYETRDKKTKTVLKATKNNQPNRKYPRFVASEVLDAVYSGQSFNEALTLLSEELSDSDKQFVQFLLYGALRKYESLNDQLNQLMAKPIKKSEQIVHGIFILALFEVTYMRTQHHACVNLWVETTKQHNKLWATGLLNAVLRKIIDQGAPEPNTHLGQINLPRWLWANFSNDYPNHATTIANFYQIHPAMTLRINTNKISRGDYLDLLDKENIGAIEHGLVESAIVLEYPVPVYKLPHFNEGFCSVQDASAQCAAFFLSPKQDEYILDACAAPGGKTGHILELENSAHVVAVDLYPKRLEQISENIHRIFGKDYQGVKLISKDILNFYADKNRLFDAILLDAPCSGTGVLHRHPDIKRLRLASDIEQLAKTQQEMLNHSWSLLKSGGRLLYVTCSILKAENEAQMIKFFADHPDASEIKLDVKFGIAQTHGLQILPISNKPEYMMDGFYYCLIEKRS